MAREDWTTFLKGQPLAYRGILVMLRDGCSYAEVAETLKIDESVIRRIIGRVKEKQLADTSV
jgi:transposase